FFFPFFFQAEDGIRDFHVTGVQTCALPILRGFDVKMLEAARDLGATESRIFWKIILPLATPAVASGWLLSFTLSLDDVIVSAFRSEERRVGKEGRIGWWAA